MKSIFKHMMGVALVALLMVFSFTVALAEGETAYGADAAKEGETYTVEQMLTYALQDEYLAQAEYKAIIGKYGVARPFANTLRAEGTHIAQLTALMKANGIAIPENDADKLVTVPATVEEALKAGVTAEEKNIAMYENFLKQEGLTDDVKAVFEQLKKASEKHLAAFTRNASRAGKPQNGKNAADTTGSATANNGMGRQQGQNGKRQNQNPNPNDLQNGIGKNRGFGNRRSQNNTQWGKGRMDTQFGRNAQNNQCPNCPMNGQNALGGGRMPGRNQNNRCPFIP